MAILAHVVQVTPCRRCYHWPPEVLSRLGWLVAACMSSWPL